LKIGAYLKSSFSDYPGKVAAVIFTLGCNFRCPWCYNPGLVDPQRYVEPIPEEEILESLARRRRYIDSVVISGGEPTLQPDLVSFIQRLKDMGFQIKLDTNGSRPEVVFQLLEQGLLSCLAVDYKLPLRFYREILSSPETPLGEDIGLKVKETLILALKYAGGYWRTTVVPRLHTPRIIEEMIREAEQMAKEAGVTPPTWGEKRWRVQEFWDTGDLVGPRLWEDEAFLASWESQ